MSAGSLFFFITRKQWQIQQKNRENSGYSLGSCWVLYLLSWLLVISIPNITKLTEQ